MRWLLVLLLVACGGVACDAPAQTDAGGLDAGPPPEPALTAAAVSLDITPEPGITIVGFGNRTSTAVRDPLEAAVLLMERDRERVALVTLDLPGVTDWYATMIRQRVALAVQADIDEVIVTASHTHSAPMIGDDAWSRETLDRLVTAAETLPGALTEATLTYGESEVGFVVNRRLVVDGEAIYGPDFEGPRDGRVRVLRVRREDALIATVVHLACHPNILRGPDSPLISADFVGDARAFREDDAPWLFLQGAAGDTRPAIVEAHQFREGTPEDVTRIGAELGAAIGAAPETPIEGPLAAARAVLDVERTPEGRRALELSALRLGPLLLVTIPGEPITDIGLHIEDALIATLGEAAIPVVLGYTNGYADYIVTDEARMVGGYEVRRSYLVPEATPLLEQALVSLGVGVFEGGR